ncbi:STAS domain-containing protein [Chloroflexia bacterium SDU3-3]|nr:STAS domain-containing protein [Chloroflexia bacterium SDU3-3]
MQTSPSSSTRPSDQLDLRSVALMRSFFVTMLVFAVVGATLPFATGLSMDVKSGLSAAIAVSAVPSMVGIWFLRRGAIRAAVWVVSLGLVLVASLVLAATGLAASGATLCIYAIPVVIAGVLLGGRGAVAIAAASVAGVLACVALERLGAPIVGLAAPSGDNTVGIVGGFVVVLAITAFCVGRFGGELRRSLASALEREHELAALSGSLEHKVAERTAALQHALDELAERSVAQQILLDELAEQRQVIDEMTLPILPVGRGMFVLPLIGALDGGRMQMAQQRALAVAGRGGARHLIVDVSGVPVIDTAVAQGLLALVASARLVGLQITLVGIRPEVAQALVSLGVDLAQVRTEADLESALAQLGR